MSQFCILCNQSSNESSNPRPSPSRRESIHPFQYLPPHAHSRYGHDNNCHHVPLLRRKMWIFNSGSEIVQKMGGLQKFTNWRGPMLTDSGGYQIFSMGFGSVSNEIKGKRDTEAMGWNQSLIKIDETGATFRSYVGEFKYSCCFASTSKLVFCGQQTEPSTH